MRISTLVFVVLSSGIFAAYAQQSGDAAPAAQASPANSDPRTGQLTPAEQREKSIRMADPLEKASPLSLPDAQQPSAQQGASPASGTSQDLPSQQQPSAAPLPGSAAASNSLTPANPRSGGPQVVTGDPALANLQDYTGPAVLSRSYTISRPLVPQQERWTPSLGISAVYDTGLTGPTLNSNGTLSNLASYGSIVRWGLSGRHFWSHDQAGLTYTGNYNHYNSQSAYNGANHFLNADLAHEFSRRLSLNLVESGSITSQGNSLLNSSALLPGYSDANVNLAVSPATQILDLGIRQFNSTVDLTWRQSSRLSFNFGGGFFAVQRLGSGGIGNVGYQARSDISYRYTRRMTVGIYYSYLDYAFSHRIELANANTVGGIFSYALSRTAQIRLRAGGTRIESEGLTSVAIDPVIAALIGRGSTIVDEYRLSWSPDVSAEYVKDFGRKRTLNLSYAHSIAPGNGVLMTSVQESESAGFMMTVLRHYGLTTSLGRTKLSSVSQTIGTYDTDFVSFAVTRAYRHGLGTNLEFSYRRFNYQNLPELHNQYRVSTGISWGPEEGRFW